ncbi:MAG: hypothetical protein WC675_02485 [Patescibacteria group bacterium]|jgi:hypothetical protein
MEKIKAAKVKLRGVRKFITGESRYCQNCGKESYELFEITQEGKIKNKLQYCKKCFNSFNDK